MDVHDKRDHGGRVNDRDNSKHSKGLMGVVVVVAVTIVGGIRGDRCLYTRKRLSGTSRGTLPLARWLASPSHGFVTRDST